MFPSAPRPHPAEPARPGTRQRRRLCTGRGLGALRGVRFNLTSLSSTSSTHLTEQKTEACERVKFPQHGRGWQSLIRALAQGQLVPASRWTPRAAGAGTVGPGSAGVHSPCRRRREDGEQRPARHGLPPSVCYTGTEANPGRPRGPTAPGWEGCTLPTPHALNCIAGEGLRDTQRQRQRGRKKTPSRGGGTCPVNSGPTDQSRATKQHRSTREDVTFTRHLFAPDCSGGCVPPKLTAPLWASQGGAGSAPAP